MRSALLSRGDMTTTSTKPMLRSKRLATADADGLVVRDVTVLRLRALLARDRGDETEYRELRDRYRVMADDLGFEGHMKWAAEMP